MLTAWLWGSTQAVLGEQVLLLGRCALNKYPVEPSTLGRNSALFSAVHCHSFGHSTRSHSFKDIVTLLSTHFTLPSLVSLGTPLFKKESEVLPQQYITIARRYTNHLFHSGLLHRSCKHSL